MAVIDISIDTDSDIGKAKNAVRDFARNLGFAGTSIDELDIVVSELATNLIKHGAIESRIAALRIEDERSNGIEIRSTDAGPGIRDVTMALKDSWSSRGTLGCGLGAVQRLMDEFDIQSTTAVSVTASALAQETVPGTVITTRKWIDSADHERLFDYSAYSRPLPGEIENGDLFLVLEDRYGLLVAVADGLGHGPEAATASQKAIDYLRAHPRQHFDPLIQMIHQELLKTRGAALAVARIDPRHRTLTHAAIGNVETLVYPRAGSHLLARAGVLGSGRPPKVRVNEVEWPENKVLVMFSDGISRRWDLSDMPDLAQARAGVIGHAIFSRHRKNHDDATVVVVRELR